MIISHKHKFIFFKPTKVAGTSIEVNLAKQCGKHDIVTFDKFDSEQYQSIAQPKKGFYNHIAPSTIKKRVPLEIWDSYLKITIIRNPWDLCVSRYWWEMSHSSLRSRIHAFSNIPLIVDNIEDPNFFDDAIKALRWKAHRPNPPHDFPLFLDLFPSVYTNTRFYFTNNNKETANVYLRFENLENDYEKLCERLSITYEPLPRLKTNIRKDKRHYSCMYNDTTREMVRKIFAQEIEYFGYNFETITSDH